MRHSFALWRSLSITLLFLFLAVQPLVPVHATQSVFLVKDINPGLQSSCGYNSACISSPIVFNSRLFFGADDGQSGEQLWTSDGTSTGTFPIKPASGIYYGRPFELTNVAGTLLFAAYGENGAELWRSDGTPAGTGLVRDINPGLASSLVLCESHYACTLSEFVAINKTLFFTASDGHHGFELWKSDGTAAGTALVQDINPGSPHSYLTELTNVNGTLFFRTPDAIWKSDGTPLGTSRVAQLQVTDLLNVNGTLFFSTDNGLWKSDGSPSGTVLVAPVSAGLLTAVGNVVFFSGSATLYDFQIWKSDGTAEGTTMIFDPCPSTCPFDHIGALTSLNGTLFFRVVSTGGWALWKSDGTHEGTTQLTHTLSLLGGLSAIDGKLYFTATDHVHGYELWTSDGTVQGTTMVQDIAPGFTDSWSTILGVVGGSLFFTATDGTSGLELWAMPRELFYHLPLIQR